MEYSRGGVGGVDVTELDIGEGDGRSWRACFNISGLSRGGGAGSTSGSRFSCCCRGRVGAVEPEGICLMVVPDGHCKDHTSFHCCAHLGETTLGSKLVCIPESRLLLTAEIIRDLVGGSDTGPGTHGVGDDLSVLDVESLDGAI